MNQSSGARARRRNAALGFVALGLFVSAIGATWIFLKGGFEGGVPVDAVFAAPGVGQQLPIGGDVKVRGVLVGRIADIELTEDGDAVVHMRLDSDIDVPESSTAEIRSKTAFGQKWVELIPPAGAEGPFLSAGDVIPDERTREPLELERALQLGHDLLSEIPLEDLSQLLHSLAEGFSGNEPDARKAIDRGLIALKAVNSRSEELDLSLRQLREFSEFLDDNDTDILSFMEALDQANRALVSAAPEFRSSIVSVPVFLDELTDFQELTEADLGRLVEHGATLAEIVAARAGQLKDIVVQLEPFTTVWNSGLSQPCEGAFESNLTCWQTYIMPGLDSRGLYGPGEGPDANEPGDIHVGGGATQTSALDLLEEQGGRVLPADLAAVLLAPLQESGLFGGSG